MKAIMDIFKESKNQEFIDNQISEVHWNKNVLFINPQLNGRHFYKYIQPYILLFEYDLWSTAITSMDKYKPNREYEFVDIPLSSRQILWADFIVIPFTYQNLREVYSKIKDINPEVKIVFNVDFNYYLLPKKHPLYNDFSSENSKKQIEDNIFYSDITLVTNSKLCDYIVDKFKNQLNNKNYKGQNSNVEIGTFPILIDKEIILENVELEIPEKKQSDALRVGIIATNYVWEDINSYKELLKEVKEKLGDKIKFVTIGFDGIDNETKKSCYPENLDIEKIQPCTIIHYFKQLRNAQLDLLFIPLRNTEYNQTSENYNKYIEASLFDIPTIVYNIFPYSEIINNGQNGIIIQKKSEFVEKLVFFEKNRDELKRIGETANEFVSSNFSYDKDNLPLIDDIYSK